MSELKVQEFDKGVIFTVKVIPASSRTTVSGLLDGMLKIKLSAPPQKGKANKSLIELLALQLSIKNKNIKILSGRANEIKDIHIRGISADTLKSKLGLNEKVSR